MKCCEEVRKRMSAALDGELDVQETEAFQRELENCDACLEEWAMLNRLDQELRRVLVLDIPTDDEKPTRSETVSSHPRWTTAGYLIGIAAVVLICFGLTKFGLLNQRVADGTASDSTVEATRLAATLVHATGPFEVYDADAGVWTACSPDTTPVLQPGARLRTLTEALCEFQTTDKGTIRLDEDAELVWKDNDEVLLVKGRMWCEAPSDQSISVQLPIDTESRIATFVCPSQSESHYAAQPQGISCTSTSVANKVVTAECASWSGDVSPGETLLIANEPNVQRDEQLVAAAKVWQLPLLALDDERHPELKENMSWLLAPIGYTKSRHFNEQQIRALGPRGAIPLLAYVRYSAGQPSQQTTRRTAMRLALDVADATALPLLKVLSDDRNETVADLARRITERIQNPP